MPIIMMKAYNYKCRQNANNDKCKEIDILTPVTQKLKISTYWGGKNVCNVAKTTLKTALFSIHKQ